MEHKLAVAEKEVLEELVKDVQRRGVRGDNGDLSEFVAAYDKTFGVSTSDPSRRYNNVLVAFLETFKKKEDLLVLRCLANRLLIGNFKQCSPVNDSPEQSLVRKTVEHLRYPLEYSFNPHTEGWLVSDAGMKLSKVMLSTAMVAVDCEMVLCEDGTEGLVRVGAVDRDLKVILNEFVKPDKRVVDYRTHITGVTAEDINRATLSVKDIQEKFWPILSSGTILVGHSLSHDLEVLKIDHPRVIDTSYVFKYPNDQKQRRPSLNNLCRSMLGYEVQKAGVSHDCVHDAAAAMRLVLGLIQKRIVTTIIQSKEELEAERSRFFLHRISQSLSTKELFRVLSLEFLSTEFQLDVKPAKRCGGYYCAVVVFNSSKEAEQAFLNVSGIQDKDSVGLSQKLIHWNSDRNSYFYLRKMVKDE